MNQTRLFQVLDTSEEACSICMEELQMGQRARRIIICQHSFHADCLKRWFSRKQECPLCRTVCGTRKKSIPPQPTISVSQIRDIVLDLLRERGITHITITPPTPPLQDS